MIKALFETIIFGRRDEFTPLIEALAPHVEKTGASHAAVGLW